METEKPGAEEGVQEAIDNMLKAQEGKVVGIKYTVDGEAQVVRKGGKDVEVMPDFPELEPLPSTWRKEDHHTLGTVYGCSHQIRKMQNREVPLTRAEAIKQGVTKSMIQRLEKLGYIKTKRIQLNDKAGKRVRMAAVVFLTPQGRAYVQEYIDSDYRKEIFGDQVQDSQQEQEQEDVSVDAGSVSEALQSNGEIGGPDDIGEVADPAEAEAGGTESGQESGGDASGDRESVQRES